MSKISENLLVNKARGKMGDQIMYKQRGNKTFLCKIPKYDKNAPITAKQEIARDRFAEAAQYAREAIANPELKTEYAKMLGPGNTAFNLAFRDYQKAPVITLIDTSAYTGRPEETIVILATDDFRVASVWVSICSETGELLEEGNAMLHPIYRDKWTFTSKSDHHDLAVGMVRVAAADLPGNTTERVMGW
ncbi:hypothetical protein [Flavihumibacter petaseus]|uniref:Uncharacterized protein n=1 Tax=Flavihumibacter petaseus NBRC 106054 TaxID=1220578 RepID=A0A0E9MWW9_9BACT|nr:hypothetical protein [Flavihumibacter petaseus]GAO41906.1 hypothetical protein FPE01S_01_09210 [Flavihumibacter petaseus NBRC 106054]